MSRILAFFAVGAAVTACSSGSAATNAAATSPEAMRAAMAGMWDVQPRGPGRGSPPSALGVFGEGSSPSGDAQSLGRFGPSLDRRPDGDGSDLPGPDVEGLDRGDKMTYAEMTPAGRAAFEAMDPHDLPSNNCKSNGLPSLVGIPDAQEWSFDGAVLTIHYADFNTVRTIYLDGRAAEDPPSLYGHSVGRFDNGELVVTTTNLIATPGGLGRNAPGSASRSYVEHYRVMDGGDRIGGYVTIHDPEYLTRDHRVPISFVRAPEGAEIPDVECSVEASQRYLND